MAITKLAGIIDLREAEAKQTLNPVARRRFLSACAVAGISADEPLKGQDLVLAMSILDTHFQRSADSTTTSVGMCPRCKGPMKPAKLKSKMAANYCTSCRVVTPNP